MLLKCQQQLVEHKCKVLCALGRQKDAILFIEEQSKIAPALLPKIEEVKKEYLKEHGLPYLDQKMETIEKFVKWMKESGAAFDKLKMKYYGPDHRGVHAIKPILEDEIFLKVPKRLIITSQKGRETKIGELIHKSGVELYLDYLVYIAVFLLIQQKDEHSEWKPYLDVYPKIVENFPLFYSPEDRKLLAGTPMVDQIKDDMASLKKEYDNIVKAVPEFAQFTCDDYVKGKILANSRIFFVKMHDKDERIMVPLADMFNHHFDMIGQTYWRYDDDEDAFVVKAQKEIPAGQAVYTMNKEQICENYGQKANYRFLFYYGFAIESNNKNCVYVKLHLNPKDPLNPIKENMIGPGYGSYIKTFTFYENYADNEKENNKFLGYSIDGIQDRYLRFIEYKGDLNMLIDYLNPPMKTLKEKGVASRKLRLPPISAENEKQMLQKLKQVAEKCLGKFPESYESDVKMLSEDKTMSFNKRNCLIYRAGEKKVRYFQ